jgi:cation diffusion facilitator CzcD-associated flavoprotein CzcO
MTHIERTDPPAAENPHAVPEYDFVIIGVGPCGLFQLHRLLQLGVRVTALDANSGVGGTWYRNRYPGCRFDSESFSYAYSFSQELLQEWDWSERFAAQPETLRYLNYVADKFSLRERIQSDSRVTEAVWDQELEYWTLRVEGGREVTTRFMLTAIGLLSAPTLPRLPGMDSFRGPSFHTFYWPGDGVELEGKRVGVVGTGATGVQVISAIADQVGDLTVFQRHPNWCAPLNNGAISPEEMAEIKASYDEIFERCRQSPSGFIHKPDPRKTLQVPEEERIAHWEELYRQPGFGIWLGNYKDTLTDETANAVLSKFIAAKIRERVDDPAIAEKLIPTDHGFGTRRVPLETQYYEAYNRPNVHLVDISETPIERVTETGLRTSERDYEFDVIIYATGFDAVVGAFDRIEIAGVGGVRLRDVWRDDPVTYLGIQTVGFPNLLMLLGPQSGSVGTNFPRGIDDIVNWTSDFAEYLWKNGYTRVEARPEAQEEWVEHVRLFADKVLFSKGQSWLTGYNSNVDRSDKRRLMVYSGGALRYRQRLAEQSENGYPSFKLSKIEERPGSPA